jgi:hypothetical protein
LSSNVAPIGNRFDPPDDPRAELLDQRERLEAKRAHLAKVDTARSAAKQALGWLDAELAAIEEMEPRAGLWIDKAEGPPPSTHMTEREDIACRRVLAGGDLV